MPFLAVTLIGTGVAWQYAGVNYSIPLAMLFIYFVLVFRDPRRDVPAVPLGIVSPVDGIVVGIGLTDKSVLNGEAHKIIIRVHSLGTYTARLPVEGKIMDFRGPRLPKRGHVDPGVRVVANTEIDISKGALSERVRLNDQGTEIDRLAETFNSMLDKIQ